MTAQHTPGDIERFSALFMLAGIPVKKVYEIANQYWPEDYVALRKQHPWALMSLDVGLVQIGWRKNVISINWSYTSIRSILTEDSVTKDESMVHAWSYGKALEYLTALSAAIQKATHKEQA